MPTSATRSESQREAGARYDTWHVLLVRMVHPLCFGAFTMLAIGLSAIVGAIALEVADSDGAGIAFAIIVALFCAVYAAFTFVLTLHRALACIGLLGAAALALVLFDDLDRGLLWAIWSIAGASVVLQVSLLAWVLPRRWRAGLLHLVVPATMGTIVGAVPVVVGINALVHGDQATAQAVALVTALAALAVVVALVILYLYVRSGSEAIERAFRQRVQGKNPPRSGDDRHVPPPLVASLVPTWSRIDASTAFRVDERHGALVTGFSQSRAPDVPSIYLTVLSLGGAGAGQRDALGDLWIRRRDWSHDNLLVNTANTPVVRFESIALDEEWSFRFAPGTSESTAYEHVGPQVLAALEGSIGAAQVCRMGGAWHAWIVGGATSAGELVRLLELLGELDRLLSAGSG